jgi:hypothetical protein
VNWCAAQATPRPTPAFECPGTSVIASSERVVDGDTVTFQYEIAGGKNIDRGLLKYIWYVDRGRIAAGQGTPVILVDTSGQGPAGSLTATTQVSSPYEGCEWITSANVRVRRKGPLTKAEVFWEWFLDNGERYYGFLQSKGKEHTEILEDFAAELRKVDSDLTYKLVPDEKEKDSYQLLIGYSGKEDKSKIVKDLVDRAPIHSGFNVMASKP